MVLKQKKTHIIETGSREEPRGRKGEALAVRPEGRLAPQAVPPPPVRPRALEGVPPRAEVQGEGGAEAL